MGRADPLETASLLVTVGHLLPGEAYDTVSRAARAAMGLDPVTITAGAPAELLAVRATTLREAIATAPADRFVFHKGRLVARTRVTTEFGRGYDPGGYDTERSHD
jgi:cytosine deaminase